ncbi:hypothetical protein A9Q81_15970 [Gammaproteobacteria bacterium 42_54_T18]|nr:hypothetical protein A9Q81_15970 [Gammaproteobacteria bacterium 42_54_T18]
MIIGAGSEFTMRFILYISVILLLGGCNPLTKEQRELIASLKERELPAWYDDAKLGIFIHWGPYTVPAFAPTENHVHDTFLNHYENSSVHVPYAEWYWNALQNGEGATYDYHIDNFGEEYPYQQFGYDFQQAVSQWDPDAWAEQFAAAGAKYVVLTTKHHDGFLLWPSAHQNPNDHQWYSERDLVGELAAAVRARGMKFGIYYSGGFDWMWNQEGFGRNITELIAGTPTDAGYGNYVEAHFRELVERYEPSVLWNDISYPGGGNLWPLVSDYYEMVPDGVINDRFSDMNPIALMLRNPSLRALADKVIKYILKLNGGDMTAFMAVGLQPHYDFKTREYVDISSIDHQKWEATRGLGLSFAYNQNETEENLLSDKELIEGFIDTVSKNGNMLVNIAVKANGDIPDSQTQRLDALGEWLASNGEGIYGTRPWERAQGETAEGEAVRFTKRDNVLYAIIFDVTRRDELRLLDISESNISSISLLSYGLTEWRQERGDLIVALPNEFDFNGPLTVAIELE